MHGYIYDSVCSRCNPKSLDECKHCRVLKGEQEMRKRKERDNDLPPSFDAEKH